MPSGQQEWRWTRDPALTARSATAGMPRCDPRACLDVTTTMVYTPVLNQGPKSVRSPMDDVSAGSYADQYKTPPVQSENTQGIGGRPVSPVRRLELSAC